MKEKLTKDGEWNQKQLGLIEKMHECNGNLNLYRKSTSYKLTKKEFMYASLVQIAAGYEPEGVFLKNTYKSNDGHLADSLQEKELDDWFSFKGINHSIHVHYPGSRMISDFLIDDIFLEYAGFYGTNLKSYRQKINNKISYAKKGKN